jgi:hypothetical protein
MRLVWFTPKERKTKDTLFGAEDKPRKRFEKENQCQGLLLRLKMIFFSAETAERFVEDTIVE